METLSEKYGHLFKPVAASVAPPAGNIAPTMQPAPTVAPPPIPQHIAPAAPVQPPAQPVAAPTPAPAAVASPQNTASTSQPSTTRMILIGVGVCLFIYVCYKYFYATDENSQGAQEPEQNDSIIIEKLRASAERNKAKKSDDAPAPMRSAVSSKMPPVPQANPRTAAKPAASTQPVDPKFEKV